MDLETIINHEIFDLPKARTTSYFPKYVEDTLNEYLPLISNTNGDLKLFVDSKRTEIYQIVSGIIDSINLYYAGNTFKSQEVFNSTLKIAKPYMLIPINTIMTYGEFTKTYFFKASNRKGVLSRSDMFHRPFEQREKINTYRYSIPGLPCLYLTNRTYNAWEELERPDFNSLNFSMFDLHDSFRFLHFGQNIFNERLQLKLADYKLDKMFLNYLIYFPLQLVCSIRVLNPGEPFIPEYIFTQFLMEWIKTESGVDGIEFLSSKYTKHQFSDFAFSYFNYAIPIKHPMENGFCPSLKKMISLTEPISWNTLNIIKPHFFSEKKKELPKSFNRMILHFSEIEIVSGIKQKYLETSFGILEEYIINEMKTEYLK